MSTRKLLPFSVDALLSGTTGIYCRSPIFMKSMVIGYQIWGHSLISYIQGVPKKMSLFSGFEFLTLGGVFIRVKMVL